MSEWKMKDSRREVVFVDIDELVPKDHLLRKIEKVMDYDWLYKRLEPYYCHDNGRPGMLLPWRDTKKRFTAQVVSIEGNHDPNNGVKSVAESMRLVLGRIFHVVLCHYPSTDPRSRLHLKPGDINICGHCHELWNGERYMVDKHNKVLNINVCTDLWDYQPVSEVTLVNFIKQILESHWFNL